MSSLMGSPAQDPTAASRANKNEYCASSLGKDFNRKRDGLGEGERDSA